MFFTLFYLLLQLASLFLFWQLFLTINKEFYFIGPSKTKLLFALVTLLFLATIFSDSLLILGLKGIFSNEDFLINYFLFSIYLCLWNISSKWLQHLRTYFGSLYMLSYIKWDFFKSTKDLFEFDWLMLFRKGYFFLSFSKGAF